MRKILFLLAMVFCASAAFAGEPYSGYISTSTAVIYNGAARVDEFDVENSSNVAQTVTIYDGTTAKWQLIVPASSGRDVHLSTYMRFGTNVSASCQDTYANQKVKFHIIAQ